MFWKSGGYYRGMAAHHAHLYMAETLNKVSKAYCGGKDTGSSAMM